MKLRTIVACAGLACASFSGCARHHAAQRADLFHELEERARALGAEHNASSDMELYRTTRSDAEALALDSPERAELETAARAYLSAAIASAERDQLGAQRLDVEARLVAREEELTHLDTARLEAERELGLTRARAIVGDEIARAYTRLGQRPARRPKLARAELDAMAKALLTRAELILLALADSEVDAKLRGEAEGALLAAKAVRPTTDALDAADAALSRAIVLLTRFRTAAGPTDAERGSLRAALDEQHFHVTRGELGLSVVLGTHSPEGLAHVTALCRVASAHPHGTVAVLGAHPGELAQLQSAWKEAGCSPARLAVLPGPAQPTQTLSFTAY